MLNILWGSDVVRKNADPEETSLKELEIQLTPCELEGSAVKEEESHWIFLGQVFLLLMVNVC